VRKLLFILLPSLLLVPSLEVFGSSHGMEGYSETGCTCHGSNAGSDTSVEIIGIPEDYTHGERYDLTIILSGGPPEAPRSQRRIQSESIRWRIITQRFNNICH